MSYYKFGDNFKWFVARVSDLADPEYLGRVKIRILHNQTGELGKVKQGRNGVKNEDLLWAWPLSGIQSASLSWKKLTEKNAGLEEFDTPDWVDAVGISPTGIAVGTYVFGFYLDAFEQNIPIIFGTYHKKSIYPEPPSDDPETNSMLQLKEPSNPEYYSDVAALARGESGDGGQTLPKEPYTQADVLKQTSEPESPYATEYPYNTTYTTKSGHAIELDDTPKHERIHVWHKSGSYEEIANDADNFTGRRVKKTVGDDYEIVEENKNILIKKNVNGEVGNNVTISIANNVNGEVGNNVTVSIGNNGTITIGGTLRIVADESFSLEAPGGITLTNGSLTVANGGITASEGATGDFEDPNGKVISVVRGIITEIKG